MDLLKTKYKQKNVNPLYRVHNIYEYTENYNKYNKIYETSMVWIKVRIKSTVNVCFWKAKTV
jgi:hypothetical protein